MMLSRFIHTLVGDPVKMKQALIATVITLGTGAALQFWRPRNDF